MDIEKMLEGLEDLEPEAQIERLQLVITELEKLVS
jgi:hypothetical protein